MLPFRPDVDKQTPRCELVGVVQSCFILHDRVVVARKWDLGEVPPT